MEEFQLSDILSFVTVYSAKLNFQSNTTVPVYSLFPYFSIGSSLIISPSAGSSLIISPSAGSSLITSFSAGPVSLYIFSVGSLPYLSSFLVGSSLVLSSFAGSSLFISSSAGLISLYIFLCRPNLSLYLLL